MLLKYVGELKSKRTTNYHQYTAYRFINEKFPQSAHTGKQKKKYYPGVFFSKQLLKNEDLFTIMLSFVLSLFFEQK